uniref:Uncharacterized protein n=1 Tax=Cannabis sativa TaxID=3483 RepID=A0A803P3A1_CANSA
MREILYEELEVDPLAYDLKLEIYLLYMKGQLVLPEVIKKERQLRTFLEMRAIMSKTEFIPLFVVTIIPLALFSPQPPLAGLIHLLPKPPPMPVEQVSHELFLPLPWPLHEQRRLA